MDEFECSDLMTDDFGIEPVHIAAGVGALGIVGSLVVAVVK